MFVGIVSRIHKHNIVVLLIIVSHRLSLDNYSVKSLLRFFVSVWVLSFLFKIVPVSDTLALHLIKHLNQLLTIRRLQID